MRLFKARFDQPQGTPDSDLHPNPVRQYASCDCLRAQYRHEKWDELRVHDEAQDTGSEAWHALEQYIAEVAASGRDELNPLAELGPERWEQIVTLPRSIKNLKSVKVLELYGSHLVRIPPEVGEMTSLEEFDPYTSNSLHWFPYEITHCTNLKRSRVSTRALYGNYKYRPPFPSLPVVVPDATPVVYSICGKPFDDACPHQVWISLRVATDVLPLLVHSCSKECVEALPVPPPGYVQEPHTGGLQLKQPPAME